MTFVVLCKNNLSSAEAGDLAHYLLKGIDDMSNIEVSKQSIDDSNFPKGRNDEDFSPSVQAKFCGLPFPVSGVLVDFPLLSCQRHQKAKI